MRLGYAVALSLVAALCSAPDARAQAQGTAAQAAVVYDMTSGTVLLEKGADVPLPPSSMSKLMTLFMVFEALQSGQLSMTDKFRTSGRASAMGGSRMFLREGELVSVGDLLKGVVVHSGNDAAVALAEALAGTEEAFAQRMNDRAAALRLTGSFFSNATGWPDPDQRMSPRDLVRLSRALIERFPEYYPMFAETEFTWAGITQKNRNPLLTLGVGADGLKTGHTEEAGYGLAASAVRGNRRVVIVITGLTSVQERRTEAERLINWAFRAFDTTTFFKAGESLVDAPVWLGAGETVSLAPARDVIATVPYGALDKVEAKLLFDGPIPAPIEADTPLGHIEITVPGLEPTSIPLVAVHDVERGGVLSRIKAAGTLILSRVLELLG